jgi:hypothetical protein
MASRVAVTPKKQKQQEPEGILLPLEQDITQRAHAIYLQRGGRDGSELNDWLRRRQKLQRSQGKKA